MREGSPEWMQVQDTIRVFAGAPLTVLMVLMAFQRPATVQELTRMGPHGHGSIEKALRTLEQRGYVCHVGGHRGWELTRSAYQLPLLRQVASGRQLDTSSGGGGLEDGPTVLFIPTPTTPEVASERQLDTLLPTDRSRLVDKLLVLGGLSVKDAERAVSAALGRGEAPAEIDAKVVALTAYAYSSRGSGLKMAGAWAAPFIEKGYQAPQVGHLPGADTSGQGDLSRFDGYLHPGEDPNDETLPA